MSLARKLCFSPTPRIIGLPPFGGTWSKWYLALGAADAEQIVFVGAFMLSSLLNIAYLMPVVIRGFLFGRKESDAVPAGTPVSPAIWANHSRAWVSSPAFQAARPSASRAEWRIGFWGPVRPSTWAATSS